MRGREVAIVWQGRRARAFVPDLIAGADLPLDAASAGALATARTTIEHAAASLPADYAPLARLMLRSEGLSSSYIEGITAPVVDVVVAELSASGAATAAGWVATNMQAISLAIEHASGTAPLRVADLLEWHRILMTGSPTPERYVGVLRTEQGWIGGTSPLDAHLVTPPPERVPELVDDLVAYLNRTDLDPVLHAAVAHVQLELIHPFGDGNGRLGRLLVSWVLTRRLGLLAPPPVSTAIAQDVGGYVAGLTQYRLDVPLQWVRWFADAVTVSSRSQLALVSEAARITDRLKAALAPSEGERKLRSDSLVHRVIELLPRHVVLTAPIVAEELDVTFKAANDALAQFIARGALIEHGRLERPGAGRNPTLYVSRELLGLAGATPLR